MEQGRIDFMLRIGFIRFLRNRRWSTLLGSTIVRFRKPLRRFQKFRVRARLVYWDDRWVYLEHRLERGDQFVASGLAKNAILGPEGRLSPGAVFAAFGYPMAVPKAPSMIEVLEEGERLMDKRVERWPALEWSLDPATSSAV